MLRNWNNSYRSVAHVSDVWCLTSKMISIQDVFSQYLFVNYFETHQVPAWWLDTFLFVLISFYKQQTPSGLQKCTKAYIIIILSNTIVDTNQDNLNTKKHGKKSSKNNIVYVCLCKFINQVEKLWLFYPIYVLTLWKE